MQPSVSEFLPSAQCFQGSPSTQHVSVHSLWSNNLIVRIFKIRTFAYLFINWISSEYRFCVVLSVISLGYVPRSRIAGSYSNFMFNFLKKCQTVFQSSYTILHCHHEWEFQFLQIHDHICGYHLDYGCSCGNVIFHYGFDL